MGLQPARAELKQTASRFSESAKIAQWRYRDLQSCAARDMEMPGFFISSEHKRYHVVVRVVELCDCAGPFAPYSTLSLCYSLLDSMLNKFGRRWKVHILTLRTDLLNGLLLYVLPRFFSYSCIY